MFEGLTQDPIIDILNLYKNIKNTLVKILFICILSVRILSKSQTNSFIIKNLIQ